MTVTAMANGMFDVTSERDETVSYIIDPTTVSCTCPDWRGRRREKELDDPDRRCKHMRKVESEPQPTKLSKALTIAQTLPDADLKHYAAEKAGTAAGCACLLALAERKSKVRDWSEWPWLDNEPDSLRDAEKEASAPPRPIPAGVLELLQGATDAERERALAIYGG